MKTFSILLFTLFAVFSVAYTLNSKKQDDEGDMKSLMRELMKGVVVQVQEEDDQQSVAELESALSDLLSEVQQEDDEGGRLQQEDDEGGRLQQEDDEGGRLQQEDDEGGRLQQEDDEGGRLQQEDDEGGRLQEDDEGGRLQQEDDEGGRLQQEDDEGGMQDDEGDDILALLQEEGDDAARRQDDEGGDDDLAFLQDGDDDEGAVIQDENEGGEAIEQGFFGRIFRGIRRFGGRVRKVCNRVNRYSRALKCLPRMQAEMQKADEGDDEIAKDLLRRIANLQQEGGEGDAEAQIFGKLFKRVRGFFGRGRKMFRGLKNRVGGLVRGYRRVRTCMRRFRG